jgi:hypothetical protein
MADVGSPASSIWRTMARWSAVRYRTIAEALCTVGGREKGVKQINNINTRYMAMQRYC